MNNKYLLSLTLVILLASGCTSSFGEKNLVYDDTRTSHQDINCKQDPNGMWTSFDNTHADLCPDVIERLGIVYRETENVGCDCGPKHCWGGISCELRG